MAVEFRTVRAFRRRRPLLELPIRPSRQRHGPAGKLVRAIAQELDLAVRHERMADRAAEPARRAPRGDFFCVVDAPAPLAWLPVPSIVSAAHKDRRLKGRAVRIAIPCPGWRSAAINPDPDSVARLAARAPEHQYPTLGIPKERGESAYLTTCTGRLATPRSA